MMVEQTNTGISKVERWMRRTDIEHDSKILKKERTKVIENMCMHHIDKQKRNKMTLRVQSTLITFVCV